MPPVVAVGNHRDVASDPVRLIDDDLLDRRGGLFESVIDVLLERDFLAASPAAIGGDHEFGGGVVVAVGDGVGGEASEDDRVDGSDAGTGEHRDCQFGDHRHVERDAVAGLDAQFFEDVGELADLAVELLVGEDADVARLAFPDDGGLVLAGAGEVPVETLVTGVEFASREPLGLGHLAFHRGVEVLEPVEVFLGELAPEARGVVLGLVPHFLVLLLGRDVGLGGELRCGGEFAVFGEDGFDILGCLGHWLGDLCFLCFVLGASFFVLYQILRTKNKARNAESKPEVVANQELVPGGEW